MAFTRADIPDLSDHVAVVTGANGGLGLQTAKALAGHGAQVLMAIRDRAKADVAMEQIRRSVPGADLKLVDLDLGSLASIRAAADTILDSTDRIDILVNNAGLMATPEQTTADGFELQLGVNHLGHWALTAHLLPAILAAPAGRVVTVTSQARHLGRPVNLANPHLHGTYRPWKAYGQAKLANYHFALGLQREFDRAGTHARSLMAHPGLSHTDLQARSVESGGGGWMGPFFHVMAMRVGSRPAEGALPQLRAATDPRARGGQLFGPRYGPAGPPQRLPIVRPGATAAIDRLWLVSERETGIPLTVACP